MAWTHFTDWLEEGDILTAAQYRELIDAIEERMLATCSGFAWVGDDEERTGMYALIDAAEGGLKTGNAYYTRFDGVTATPSTSNLIDLLFELSGSYASTYREAPFWGSDMYFEAQDDLGYDYDETDALVLGFLDDGVESYKVWNLIRRMVQHLRYPWAKIQAESNKYKTVTLDPDDYADIDAWRAAMLAAWLAASESDSSYLSGYYCMGQVGEDYYQGYRTVSTVEIPDLPIFDSYEAWIYFDQDGPGSYYGDTSQTDSINVTLNSVPFSRLFRYDYTTFDLEQILLLGAGLSGVGSIPIVIELDSYSDSTVAAHNLVYANGASFHNGWIVESAAGIYLAPTFTHPYEAMA